MKTILTSMNNITLERVYNCSAWVLELNITLLLKGNRSEFRHYVEEALNKSTRPNILREALSDCIFVNQERPFDLPWWQKLFWSLIFAVILLIATGGNIIVMWIVLGKKIKIARTYVTYMRSFRLPFSLYKFCVSKYNLFQNKTQYYK